MLGGKVLGGKVLGGKKNMGRWASIGLMIVLVAACGSTGGPPKSVAFEVKLSASEGLNPDTNGRPSPLMIAVYQLKSADNFSNLDFFSAFGGSALSDDLVHREQVTVRPGEAKTLSLEFDGEANFVGVVGAFSDIENASWRGLLELPSKSLMEKLNIFRDDQLIVDLGDQSVSLSLRKR